MQPVINKEELTAWITALNSEKMTKQFPSNIIFYLPLIKPCFYTRSTEMNLCSMRLMSRDEPLR